MSARSRELAAALVAHLEALAPGGARAALGWPSGPLDLATGPVVTVLPGDPTEVAEAPSVAAMDVEAGTVAWRVAQVDVLLQVDVFAAYEAQRDDVLDALRAAFSDPPFGVDLELELGDGELGSYVLEGGVEVSGEADEALDGEYRATLTVRAQAPRLETRESAFQLEHDVSLEME